jgi:hypothetical protein
VAPSGFYWLLSLGQPSSYCDLVARRSARNMAHQRRGCSRVSNVASPSELMLLVPSRGLVTGAHISAVHAQKSIGAHTIGGSWSMLAWSCVTNENCDANEKEFWKWLVTTVGEKRTIRTPNARIYTSIRQHLNFKRSDVRSGGATRRLEEKRRSCLQRKVAHGIEDDHVVQTLAADGSETSRSRQ